MDWLSIALSSIISLIIGIVVSRHYAARRAINYLSREEFSVDFDGSKAPPGLKITYDGGAVDGFKEIKLAVWNSGNQPITKNEFLNGKCLQFKIKKGNLIAFGDARCTRNEVAPVLRRDDNIIFLEFDNLEKTESIFFPIYMDVKENNVDKIVDLESNIIGLSGKVASMSERIISGIDDLIPFLGMQGFFGFATYYLIRSTSLESGRLPDRIVKYIVSNGFDQIDHILLQKIAIILIGILSVLTGLMFIIIMAIIIDEFRYVPKEVREYLGIKRDFFNFSGIRVKVDRRR